MTAKAPVLIFGIDHDENEPPVFKAVEVRCGDHALRLEGEPGEAAPLWILVGMVGFQAVSVLGARAFNSSSVDSFVMYGGSLPGEVEGVKDDFSKEAVEAALALGVKHSKAIRTFLTAIGAGGTNE